MLKPEDQMAALFEGLSRIQQLALLGRLEKAGGRVYRALAHDEQNAKARDALLKAADDEDRNGDLLVLMTTPKVACEKCAAPLPAHTDGYSCSFQCTFCEPCASATQFVCPNCGGALTARSRLHELRQAPEPS
jgi:hypothetical protein